MSKVHCTTQRTTPELIRPIPYAARYLLHTFICDLNLVILQL